MSIESSKQIKIMLVDDSSVIRSLLRQYIAKDADMAVITEAQDGEDALKKAAQFKPDVILLDVEMPKMDGITALPKLLELLPKAKIIMCSTLTERGAVISLKALSLGAVECLAKPSSNGGDSVMQLFEHLLLRTIRGLFPDRIQKKVFQSTQTKQRVEDETVKLLRSKNTAPEAPQATNINRIAQEDCTLSDLSRAYGGTPKVIAIGSSTGGPQALYTVLKNLQNINIPIVITQHMPPKFTTMLAEHITQQCKIECIEAQDGIKVEPNKAYLAAGGFHMLFKKVGNDTIIKLDDGPPINFCKPAVDPMMQSLIKIYGQTILGVILTGMGQDGLEGGKELIKNNGRLIAQDKETSTVWGMPGAVASAGLCHKILPLDEIGPWIKKLF